MTNARLGVGATAAALVVLIAAALWQPSTTTASPQPAPQALDMAHASPDLSQALDRIAASNDAQTRALIALTRQLSGVQGDFSALEARVNQIEQAQTTATTGSSTTSSTASCPGGICPMTYSTQAQARSCASSAAASAPVGLFGGRWAPFKRLAARRPLRRLGWRLIHPFAGRFRR